MASCIFVMLNEHTLILVIHGSKHVMLNEHTLILVIHGSIATAAFLLACNLL
jgi:hypothetical protein